MDSTPRRALPLLAVALALACGGDDGGDDGDDDTAAGTTVATSTGGAKTSTAATEFAGGDSTMGAPMECEGLCAGGEVCVVLRNCTPDPPYCVPPDMVSCDSGTDVCTLMDVCSGMFYEDEGWLDCESCFF